MPVELTPLLAAGLVGGLAMMGITMVARAAGRGVVFDAPAYWSRMLGLTGGAGSIGGLAIHLLVSVGVAAGYVLAFAVAGVTDMGWAWGLIGGVIHWVAAGAFVAIGGAADATAPSPGAFGRELGPNGGVAFLAAHLLFGILVGFVYLLLHSSGGFDASL